MVKRGNLDKVKGSLFGGAIGDALGYAVEFRNEAAIRNDYGPEGISEYKLRNGFAVVSDDTQMTLFTANGLLVANTKRYLGNEFDYEECVYWSYKDWLETQDNNYSEYAPNKDKRNCHSWLCDVPRLFFQRAPGCTCIDAISSKQRVSIRNILNNSKGCGGVMRVAPVGLINLLDMDLDIKKIDYMAAELAALTHGHSLGYMPASVLAHIVNRIVYPKAGLDTLKDIVIDARDTISQIFEGDKHLKYLVELINKAIKLSESDYSDIDCIHFLGEGWVGEETLAIAIYCSLKYQNDFSKAIQVSVNHRGDSDSTGAVTGNIIGAWIGFDAIDKKWIDNLEMTDVISEIAEDLSVGVELDESGNPTSDWMTKYSLMTKL